MNNEPNSQAGFLIIKVALLIAAMVIGYVAISNVLSSEEGQEATETVNDIRQKADTLLDN